MKHSLLLCCFVAVASAADFRAPYNSEKGTLPRTTPGEALAHLRKQRHDVLVFQTLDPAEIDLTFKKPCELRDLETGERLPVNPRGLADEYRKVFGAFLEQYQKACAGMNIDYRLVRTDQPLESFVRTYLKERRRLSR